MLHIYIFSYLFLSFDLIDHVVLPGSRGPGIQKSLIVGIIVVRYVVLPLAGILVVKGALKFGLVHYDPLYLFVLLLQFSLPPAMNIGTYVRSSGGFFLLSILAMQIKICVTGYFS